MSYFDKRRHRAESAMEKEKRIWWMRFPRELKERI